MDPLYRHRNHIPPPDNNPYFIQQTPRGSVVVCRGHLLTDEIKPSEAKALADALNLEHQVRMLA